MKKIIQNKRLFFFLMVMAFISLGSFGTVALANYTNVLVEASAVNVRMGPGLSYDIMTQVQGGTTVNVLAEKNEWYKVRLDDGRIGWIASWLINNTEVAASSNLIATVHADSANVRAENSEDAEIIGTAAAGEQFALLYEESGWSQIEYQGRVAWINSELVDITSGSLADQSAAVSVETAEAAEADPAGSVASGDVVTVLYDAVNVRAEPSTDSDILEVASQGQEYEWVDNVDDYYQVLTATGETAYIANWLASSGTETEAQSSTTLAEATIVIDPGHGGNDPGAEAASFYEKEVTLSTAEAVAAKLEASGANVILTRTEDEYVELGDRAALSNSLNADLFISIHFDSTPEGVVASGTSTYYYSDADAAIAELVNSHLSGTLPLANNGIKFGDFKVLRDNTQTALLLELGYINNENDAAVLNTGNYRELVAASIYDALTEYFQ